MLPILIFTLFTFFTAQALATPDNRYLTGQVDTRMLRKRLQDGPTHRLTARDSGASPIPCTSPAFYDAQSHTCKCPSGYRPYGDGSGFQLTCIFCPEESTSTSDTCTCNEPSLVYNAQTNTCGCSVSDSYLSNGECVCNFGLIRENGACVSARCAPPAYYDSRFEDCVCLAETLKISGNGNSLVCRQCPNGAYFELGSTRTVDSCKCITPGMIYNLLTNACECPSNSSLVGSQCTCNEGYLRENGICIEATCVAPAAYKSWAKNCVCDNNSRQIGQGTGNQLRCQTCPDGSISYYGSCLCTNRVLSYIPDRNTCECSLANSSLVDGQCVCDDGYIKEDGVCMPAACQAPAIYDSTAKDCVCSSGTRKIDGAGNSVRCRSCPDGAVLDDRTGSCNCRATSSFYDSRTDTCRCTASNASLVDSRCTCDDGYVSQLDVCSFANCVAPALYDTATRTCACGTGSRAVNALTGNALRCQLCPSSSSPSADGNSCVCDNPVLAYKDETNTCDCPLPNSALINGVCDCQANYIKYKDQCVSSSVQDCPAPKFQSFAFESASRESTLSCTYRDKVDLTRAKTCQYDLGNGSLAASTDANYCASNATPSPAAATCYNTCPATGYVLTGRNKPIPAALLCAYQSPISDSHVCRYDAKNGDFVEGNGPCTMVRAARDQVCQPL